MLQIMRAKSSIGVSLAAKLFYRGYFYFGVKQSPRNTALALSADPDVPL